MKVYRVRYERDDAGVWVATAEDVQGCHTQGRSIRQARDRIREALSLYVDDADDADLDEHIVLPADARRVLKRTTAARRRAARASDEAQEATQAAVDILTKELQLSVRDAAELLGLSHQRVQQLAG